MSWEFLSDHIRNKVEKTKKQQGFITASQLEGSIDDTFHKLQFSEGFEDYFEGIDTGVRNEWLAKIKLRIKSVVATTIDPDNVIDGGLDYDRWIDKRGVPIQWNYFERYIQYLKKIGRPTDVIRSTEHSTREIIERLGDPLEHIGPLQKGLVLGSVQSGKTTNFNGVINRAIDVGYDLIIVFSGIMEDLRFQTQKRINNEVIGIGEQGNQINQVIGVGHIHTFGGNGISQINSITSTSTDFRKSLVDANFNFSNQKILVCKKNVGVLTNMIYWLRSSMPEGKKQLPKRLLVVDDEADNASLNNLGHKGAIYASKVNGHMRALLNLFERRSYLGYTATPFANILQDQHGELGNDDAWKISFRYNGQIQDMLCSLSPGLFPDKFIYKLSAPSSYLGPKRFFSTGRETEGDKKIPLIETIPVEDEDEEVVFDENDNALRKSLIDAIDCFVLSIALRDSRNQILETLPGYTKHHTMLIHISRLIGDQIAVSKKVAEYIGQLQRRIADDSMSDTQGVYEKMKRQWNRFFAYKVENITSYLPDGYNTDGLVPKSWEEISTYLPTAVQNINVRAINSGTGDKLEYTDVSSRKYIAIGGNRLSRGFTLEGLTINYFRRDTNYYDTLLQMGRWFGYRPGYIDACRLFIDFDTEEKYNFITTALTELEEQIENMELQKKKPKDFEIRIRKHPDVLKITRPAVLKSAKELRYSFQDTVQQTTIFRIQKDAVEKSWKAFRQLFDELAFTEVNSGFYTLDGGKRELQLFLDLPGTYATEQFERRLLTDYIDKCIAGGKLTNWKIGIKRGGGGRELKDRNLELKLTQRSAPRKKDELVYYNELIQNLLFTASGKSMNIMTSGMDEALGLPEELKQKAIDKFRQEKKKKFMDAPHSLTEEQADEKSRKTTIPGWIFRKVRPEIEGLLLIYLMDLEDVFNTPELKIVAEKNEINTDFPLIGYALSFPEIKDDPGGIYMANEITSAAENELPNEDAEEPEDFNNSEHSEIK